MFGKRFSAAHGSRFERVISGGLRSGGHHGSAGGHGREGDERRGRHAGGGGFGRGGFGRGGFGGGGRGGRGRFFGPGDLRLVLLALIEEKPRHGYELIKDLGAKFGGAYAPSPGSVYPTLTLLEELGHVRSSASEGTKRLVEITEEGRRHVADNQAALDSAMSRMAMAASGLVTQITLLGVLFGPPAAFAAKAGGDWTRTVMNIALAGTVMWVLPWLVIRRFSSAGAHGGVEARISVVH